MIELEQFEPGVYVYHWVGQVDMKAARASFEKLKVLNEKRPYVAIIQMQKARHVPTDIAAMRALIKEEMAQGLRGYVVFGASRAIESFIRPLSLLAPTTYRFAQDWEAGLQLARDLLHANNTSEAS